MKTDSTDHLSTTSSQGRQIRRQLVAIVKRLRFSVQTLSTSDARRGHSDIGLFVYAIYQASLASISFGRERCSTPTNIAQATCTQTPNDAQLMRKLFLSLFLLSFMGLYVYHSASPSCLFLYTDVDSSNLKLAEDSLGGGDLHNRSLAVFRIIISRREDSNSH